LHSPCRGLRCVEMQQLARWPPISRHRSAIKPKNALPAFVNPNPEFEREAGNAGRVFGFRRPVSTKPFHGIRSRFFRGMPTVRD
jgi:hypothetical protein